jgi:protein SCO1/2
MGRRVALPAVVFACVALAGCGGGSATPKSGPVLAPNETVLASLDVKLPVPAQVRIPPAFTLKNSLGRRVSLSQFMGKAVLLTFIYDHCPDVCPLIVADLHTALLKLGPQARRLQIVAVSVDPKGDTPATVKAFLAAHEMTGRMEYLIGSYKELSPVWREYGVQVQASPDQRENTVGHSAFLYGITGHGRGVVLYPSNFEPAWIVHDVPLLASA